MGVDVPVECGVGKKIAAQVGLSVLVHCYAEFAMHQTDVFFLVYSELHHEDVLVLLNKNAGLDFGLMGCILGAQCLKSSKHYLCLASDLVLFFGLW
jgi:hypothetical protein